MIAAVLLALLANILPMSGAQDTYLTRALELMAKTPLIDG